jgi:hypothetical protein
MADGEAYAHHALNDKPGVMWTFDRGDGPAGPPPFIQNGQGWKYRDLTQNQETVFRVIDATLDQSERSGAAHRRNQVLIGMDEPAAARMLDGSRIRRQLVPEAVAFTAPQRSGTSPRASSISVRAESPRRAQVYLRRADGGSF